MLRETLTMVGVADRAIDAVLQNRELAQLYEQAVRQVGEGQLRMEILQLAVDAIEDKNLKDEVYTSDESMFSLLCGVWIQYLLIEVAGIKKEKLQTMVRRIFMDIRDDKSLH